MAIFRKKRSSAPKAVEDPRLQIDATTGTLIDATTGTLRDTGFEDPIVARDEFEVPVFRDTGSEDPTAGADTP